MRFPLWGRAGANKFAPLHWLLVASVSIAVTGAGGTMVPPSASIVLQLPNEVYVHMLPLPLGRLDGAIKGDVKFDESGTRAVFIATFPGATLGGDWRSLDPVQAFVLDAGRRTLAQLTIDGQAGAVSWDGNDTVLVVDGDRRNRFFVGAPAGLPLPRRRMADAHSAANARFIALGGDGRFFIAETEAGRYAVEQIGARTLRSEGTASNGAYALVGNFLAWVDASKSQGAQIARDGPDEVAPPSFAGSSYGDSLAPIVPLGHAVYQGAYRNGAAYFAFTYGVRRIVAETTDLVAYSFPSVPNDLSYTVGDGFGADANGGLYFGRPESAEVTYWRAGRYVHESLNFPSQSGSETALEWAMQRIAPADPLWPPLRPDESALDAALLQWRFYPVGDAVGERWIASYLGRVLISDAKGKFRFVGTPQFPFAVLGRTDDGRLWGASPQSRGFLQSVLTDTASMLWWSRDGTSWLEAGLIPGDAGAVGLDHRKVWIALTHPWMGRASIAVMRLGDSSAAITGGAYTGEQLFFAALASGFYVVWGASPGRRLNGDQGPLSAYRIDQDALFADAGAGLNIFAKQRIEPAGDPSLPAASFDVAGVSTLLQPTLDALASLPSAVHSILETNAAGVQVDPARVTVMTFDQERAYEIKYAARPYPLAAVRVVINGDSALVIRSLARGPLTLQGATERWTRADDRWRRSAMLRWSSQL